MSTSLADVTEAMKDVIDPELGINVVDLGLIYDISIDDTNVAVLDMTLTSAACPLQDVIEDQTRSVLQDLVSDVKINWVWMPPWVPTRLPMMAVSNSGQSVLPFSSNSILSITAACTRVISCPNKRCGCLSGL